MEAKLVFVSGFVFSYLVFGILKEAMVLENKKYLRLVIAPWIGFTISLAGYYIN